VFDMIFDDIVKWFSNSRNILIFAQLIAAFITALATLALWRVTRVLAVETALLAKMTARPFVVCGLESSPVDATALNLVLRNTGNATAFDITAKISPQLPNANGTLTEGKADTSIEVSYLPPTQAMPRQLVMSRDIVDKKYAVEISWALFPHSAERETLAYNFEGKDGFHGGASEKGIHHVAQELEKIRIQVQK
jgi:hypothetical protein